jgi:hypothetical protein
MRPRLRRERAEADRLTRWWGSLEPSRAAPTVSTRLLPLALGLVAVAAAVAMPLPWHHQQVPQFVYYGPPVTQVVHGFDTANWLIVVAAVALALAVRTFVRVFRPPIKWWVSVMAFATVNGMIIDYIDWSLRTGSATVPTYYGPGFFVALGAAVLTIAATVLVWRHPD